MRLQPILTVGLSALTAFASATGASAGSVDSLDAEKRGLGKEIFYHARDAVVGAIHEIEVRVPRGHQDPHESPDKKTPPTEKKTTPTEKKTTAAEKKTTPAEKKTTTLHHTTKSSPHKTTSNEHHTTTSNEHHTTTSSDKHHTTTSSDKHHTATTSDKHHTSTKSSASASSTSTLKPRVRCGQKGSTCSGDSCEVARSVDLRQAKNRRAYGAPAGNPINLRTRTGNVRLSKPENRDAWIDFGTKPASVTMEGLTGCTTVIAISEKGMYAFHIWEAGEGDTLDPHKYVATLANVKSKLQSKQAELKGGELYLYLPTNPDQPGQMLYDSTHWNEDLTMDTSKVPAADDHNWPRKVPRVNDIRNAIEAGSGLQITKEKTYEARPDKTKPLHWMTAQFDPAMSETTKQFGVWTSVQGQIAQHSWQAAEAE